MSLVDKLIRPELIELEVYQSARKIGGSGDIWLNANESPFNNSDCNSLNRYPECQPANLIKAYSDYAKVDNNQVLTCRGADEAIDLLMRTFCIPKQDFVAYFTPTYGMYKVSALTNNVDIYPTPLTADYKLPPLDEKLKSAKLVFICNPNNPTGTLIDKETIESYIKYLNNSLVVIDEAYIEFANDASMVSLLNKYDNLVILRTLSKAFALAGARCGFMLANSKIINAVLKVIAPYPVPQPVNLLATNTLSKSGINLMQTQVQTIKEQGNRLIECLQSMDDVIVLPSAANFVLAKFIDSDYINTKLAKSGIIARCYSDPALTNWIRFSFGDKAQTDTLIKTLKEV